MSLLTILRTGVKIADKQTKSVQGDVSHLPFSSRGVSGPIYGTAVTRKAVIDFRQQQVRTADGTMKTCRASLTFLFPVTVTADDRFTLPDGSSAAVMAWDGPMDPITHQAIVTQVYLG